MKMKMKMKMKEGGRRDSVCCVWVGGWVTFAFNFRFALSPPGVLVRTFNLRIKATTETSRAHTQARKDWIHSFF